MQSLRWCKGWHRQSGSKYTSSSLSLFPSSFLLLQHVYFTGCSIFRGDLIWHGLHELQSLWGLPCLPRRISYTFDFGVPSFSCSMPPTLRIFPKCFTGTTWLLGSALASSGSIWNCLAQGSPWPPLTEGIPAATCYQNLVIYTLYNVLEHNIYRWFLWYKLKAESTFICIVNTNLYWKFIHTCLLTAEKTCISKNSVQNPNTFIYYRNIYVAKKNRGQFLQHSGFASQRSLQIEDCRILPYLCSLE